MTLGPPSAWRRSDDRINRTNHLRMARVAISLEKRHKSSEVRKTSPALISLEVISSREQDENTVACLDDILSRMREHLRELRVARSPVPC
jgi:hypothetical protein